MKILHNYCLCSWLSSYDWEINGLHRLEIYLSVNGAHLLNFWTANNLLKRIIWTKISQKIKPFLQCTFSSCHYYSPARPISPTKHKKACHSGGVFFRTAQLRAKRIRGAEFFLQKLKSFQVAASSNFVSHVFSWDRIYRMTTGYFSDWSCFVF